MTKTVTLFMILIVYTASRSLLDPQRRVCWRGRDTDIRVWFFLRLLVELLFNLFLSRRVIELASQSKLTSAMFHVESAIRLTGSLGIQPGIQSGYQRLAVSSGGWVIKFTCIAEITSLVHQVMAARWLTRTPRVSRQFRVLKPTFVALRAATVGNKCWTVWREGIARTGPSTDRTGITPRMVHCRWRGGKWSRRASHWGVRVWRCTCWGRVWLCRIHETWRGSRLNRTSVPTGDGFVRGVGGLGCWT